jgi:pimeloyl-ACP methyl ester carboxylesterase
VFGATRSDITLTVPAVAKVDGVEDCTAVINRLRWRYLHAGSGPALLLVHGFMGYSFSWRFVISELARHFSVYAVDLPGCGFSERSASLPASLDSDAEHLLSFMDHLGIEQCDVVGTSRGGGVTIALAGLMAERGVLHRVRRMVLAEPVNPWSRYGILRVRVLSTRIGSVYVVHLAKRLRFILVSYFKGLYGDVANIPPDSLGGYDAGMAPSGSYEHVWQMIRAWMAGLKRIEAVLPVVESVPVLLLWGTRDTAVDPESAEQLHRRWKNSAVVMMDGIGHMPYEERPQEFTRIVLDFLLRDTPATAMGTEAPVVMTHAAVENGRA